MLVREKRSTMLRELVGQLVAVVSERQVTSAAPIQRLKLPKAIIKGSNITMYQ